ncbi:phage tail family protein [Rhodococcus antarcticus]|uniref:Phage tail family protein n=1 Tax=Rhodococcus antarcticus TaxID=2987751 RepID=A0ABY6NWP8_9NOCA|nr:phage tail domain-containing protein [Rhodococcus antarcticus]UZJ23718.1 phage tail family protein [Rhodococcus antarcticus]
MRLQLESATDVLSLDGINKDGYGVQALPGATGLGLPPVQGQWLEGAGDGAVYRGKRNLSRTIDLPFAIQARDRLDLQAWLRRLSLMLAQPCTLRLVEDDNSSWFTEVVRVGGGDYSYGDDTIGEDEFYSVITFQAGDPFWTSSETSRKTVGGDGGTRGLLPRLSALQVSASQAIGDVTFENPGDAPAYPLWAVHGPGNSFEAISPSGDRLAWMGTVAVGESVFFDTRRGTVYDQLGVNRYSGLMPAPRFWSVPPGTTTASVALLDTNAESQVVVTWRPRRWMVV